MDRLALQEFKMVLKKQEGPCISIFLPTSRGGLESPQDQLRLRHQIRDTENRLLLDNLRSTEVEKLLAPFNTLLEDGIFWLHSVDGLVIFRTLDMLKHY